MPLEHQIILAVVLDLLLGDPRWFPHPVQLIGKWARFLERRLRRKVKNPYLAGVSVFMLVLLVVAGLTVGILHGARLVHPLFADGLSIFLLYTTVSIRSLIEHSSNVLRALKSNDLKKARKQVAKMVGRDCECLDEVEITRATVESVAENLVDGITAPLFFAIVAGPVGAMMFKTVSTLDSMFGHRNEKYHAFGWISAKVDDLAVFLPARLTAPLISVSAGILGMHPIRSIKIFLRDRKNHPSPNAGQSESAVAGALGIQLGGFNYYSGQLRDMPLLGEELCPLQARHIQQANWLILVSSGLVLNIFLWLRLGVRSVWGY
ncbi:MAG: cobalamin biosynthesis protein CobD [Planctomycetes bacterium]|nr:cobalamin biosynthesis protein CobD [Planctomycetota bacterium]